MNMVGEEVQLTNVYKAMGKNVRIGVEYSGQIAGTPIEVEVSILEGLKVTKNILFTGIESLKEVIVPLVNCCKQYDGKINFENNKLELYFCFKDYGYEKYLERSNGIFYTASQKDLWLRYKHLFEYDEKFETSTRIVVLSLLNDTLMLRMLDTVEEYTKKLEYLKSQIR